MPVQPQDRKPKGGQPFRFTDSDGKAHTLPLASKGQARLKGRDIRDAAMNGEVGQLTYLFKLLEAADPEPEALDALYDMSQEDMLEVLSDWGSHGDGDGASLGESTR